MTAMNRGGRPSLHSSRLSPRQMQIVEMLISGANNQEIADELHISVNTVKTHLRDAYSKMGVRNRAEAIVQILRRRQ